MNKKVPGNESFQRINFLYQASELMLKINPDVSRHYGDLIASISKKSVLRLDHLIKRTICKGCHTLLEPNVTVRIRQIKKRKRFRVKCLHCGTIKEFVFNKDYKLWTEKSESLIETISHKNNAERKNDSKNCNININTVS